MITKGKFLVALLSACVAVGIAGCDDFDDPATDTATGAVSQEEKDDRAQKAANDAIDNTGGMNVDYGN